MLAGWMTFPVITSVPWNYLSDPIGSYREASEEAAAALAAGRRFR